MSILPLFISKLFSPAEVVPYNIAYKYFSIVTIGFTIIVTPYWSSFTEAYARKDLEWIKRAMKNIQRLWLVIPIGLLVMTLIADQFYLLWVGEAVKVPLALSIGMALHALLYTFPMIYNFFVNGIGSIKLHLTISVIVMLVNIPLSIFLAQSLEMGIVGVILASSICLVPACILLPIQCKKILSGTAEGLWIK